MFSARTSWSLEESGWARAAAKAHRNGAIDLTESNPTRCHFRYAADILKSFSDRTNLLYEPDACGDPAARRAIAEYYVDRGGPVDAGRLVLTAGTSEAYSFLLKLLVDPGQTVLVPEPGYPLLDHLAQLADVHLARYPLQYDPSAGWSIDRQAFVKALTSDVRAIVVVHPNNPTGHWTSPEDRQWLEELAAERGMGIISDEVFLDYRFDETQETRSFTAESRALTFTLSGISKVLGLPQMKLSWIAVSGPDTDVREALQRLAVIADAYLTVSTPLQRALPEWLSAGQLELVHDEIGSRCRGNRAALEKALSGSRAHILKADGGWCAVLRFDGKETDEAMSLKLMESGLLVQPGYLFDLPEHHIVLSLLPTLSIFNEGVRRLTAGLTKK